MPATGAVPVHTAPFPVSIYGHGYTSARVEFLGFAGNLAKFGIASVCIDSYGHGLGDQVIRATAQVIQGCIKGRDIAVRWGGEEFLVHWPGAKSMEATRLIGELLEAVRRAPWPARRAEASCHWALP